VEKFPFPVIVLENREIGVPIVQIEEPLHGDVIRQSNVLGEKWAEHSCLG
jgi:hypothetical protein